MSSNNWNRDLFPNGPQSRTAPNRARAPSSRLGDAAPLRSRASGKRKRDDEYSVRDEINSARQRNDNIAGTQYPPEQTTDRNGDAAEDDEPEPPTKRVNLGTGAMSGVDHYDAGSQEFNDDKNNDGRNNGDRNNGNNSHNDREAASRAVTQQSAAASRPTGESRLYQGTTTLEPGLYYSRSKFYGGQIIWAHHHVGALDKNDEEKAGNDQNGLFQDFWEFKQEEGYSRWIVCSKPRPFFVMWCYKRVMFALPITTRSGRGLGGLESEDFEEDEYVGIKDNEERAYRRLNHNPYVVVHTLPGEKKMKKESAIMLNHGVTISLRESIQITGRTSKRHYDRVVELYHHHRRRAKDYGRDLEQSGDFLGWRRPEHSDGKYPNVD